MAKDQMIPTRWGPAVFATQNLSVGATDADRECAHENPGPLGSATSSISAECACKGFNASARISICTGMKRHRC
jgi:hypothetical protein